MWNSIVSVPDLSLFIYFSQHILLLHSFGFIALTVAISNQPLHSIYMILACGKQKFPVSSNSFSPANGPSIYLSTNPSHHDHEIYY